MLQFRIRRLLALLPMLALLALATPASASFDWCKTDPIVALNGTTVQILVAVPAEYVPLVNGPTKVVVKTPKGVEQELVLTDPGFNGHGEVVSFGTLKGKVSQNSFETTVRVKVPIDESALAKHEVVPVQVEVIVDGAEPVVVVGMSRRTDVALQVEGR